MKTQPNKFTRIRLKKDNFETLDVRLSNPQFLQQTNKKVDDSNGRYSTTKKRIMSASNYSKSRQSRRTQISESMNPYQPKQVLNNLLLTMRCRSDLNSISATCNAQNEEPRLRGGKH